jgi:S1-C subfamily serine protease
MIAGRTVHHALLGASLDDIDAVLATSGRVHATVGALITGVVAGGPAAKSGIRGGSTIASIDGVNYCLGGDIVTAVDGTRVTDTAALQSAIGKDAPGRKVKLSLVRAGGARTTITVRLGTQPTTNPETTTGCG